MKLRTPDPVEVTQSSEADERLDTTPEEVALTEVRAPKAELESVELAIGEE